MPRGIPASGKRAPRTQRGPARKGVRNPELLKPPVTKAAGVRYVCGARPMNYGHRVLYAGVEIPDAANWLRIDAWVGCRRVRLIPEGEDYTRFDDFAAAWDEEHPETVPPPPPEPEPETIAVVVVEVDPAVVVEEIGGPSLERTIVDLQLGPEVNTAG